MVIWLTGAPDLVPDMNRPEPPQFLARRIVEIVPSLAGRLTATAE